MIGYIYKTTIKDSNSSLNLHYYIGKRQKKEFDKSYYGSGRILRDYLKNNSENNLKVEIIYKAESVEELNNKEKEFISKFINDEKCLNIASGGIGGDTFSFLSNEEKEVRIEKLKKSAKEVWEKLSEDEKSQKMKNQIKNRKTWGNKGKKFDDEWKENISLSLKKKYAEDKSLADEKARIMRERRDDAEWKRKLSEGQKRRWSRKEEVEKQRERMINYRRKNG